MKYFFTLGNNPTLSIAEITARFPKEQHIIVSDDVFILETKEKIDANATIETLGGTIKIGEIFNEVSSNDQDLGKYINTVLDCEQEGKYKFGISYYGSKKLNDKRLAMDIKNYLREKGVSSRWVTSKERTLSSVVVEQNKLTSKGIEIVLIKENNKLLLGKTLAVQPFKELSRRDYGRPARDDRSGMLPPKLAQILINLAQITDESVILDPFCGSGTVLTESILMGHKNIIGSDISEKAIGDSRQNITWIQNNYKLKNSNYRLIVVSSLRISNKIKPSSVDAIITEPYLGPQRGEFNIKNVVTEIEELYSKSLADFYKVLKPEGVIVMIFPIFNINGKRYFTNTNLNGLKIINPIPSNLLNSEVIKLTNKNTIIYSREGQKVEREITILKKTS
ncbi:methyltransferase domain-containing protein [Patescibacteria group bacterium]|nr:methyltransferase domain-containing protein [Patescibacteria group bacterium]